MQMNKWHVNCKIQSVIHYFEWQVYIYHVLFVEFMPCTFMISSGVNWVALEKYNMLNRTKGEGCEI